MLFTLNEAPFDSEPGLSSWVFRVDGPATAEDETDGARVPLARVGGVNLGSTGDVTEAADDLRRLAESSVLGLSSQGSLSCGKFRFVLDER